jgi:hypothetical protein
VKSDWDAWNTRSLAEEPIVRLILDGTVVRVRLDRKATSISLLVVLGVRADGQKVMLAIKSMGGESAEAWRTELFHAQAPDWQLLEEAHRTERSFRFSNFREALTFVQEISELAEAERHHPNINFG